jgi:hypothetical protein
VSITILLTVVEEGWELVRSKEVECSEELVRPVGHCCTRQAQDRLGLMSHSECCFGALGLTILEIM